MKIREIVPARVWQGDVEAANQLRSRAGVEELGVRGVICSAHNIRVAYHESLSALILPIDDHDDVAPSVFDLAVDFHRRCAPTFTHCNSGKNRSVAFAAALACAEGWTPARAYEVALSTPTLELQRSLERWRELHPEGW